MSSTMPCILIILPITIAHPYYTLNALRAVIYSIFSILIGIWRSFNRYLVLYLSSSFIVGFATSDPLSEFYSPFKN